MKIKKEHTIDIIFGLILFCVFAILALIVLMTGSNVYQKTVNQNDATFQSRTTINYINEKVHQCYHQGSVSVVSIENQPALCLIDNVNGENYCTYIYQDNNQLKEAYVDANQSVDLGYGSALLEIQDLKIEVLNENLIKLTMTSIDETTHDLYINTL